MGEYILLEWRSYLSRRSEGMKESMPGIIDTDLIYFSTSKKKKNMHTKVQMFQRDNITVLF